MGASNAVQSRSVPCSTRLLVASCKEQSFTNKASDISNASISVFILRHRHEDNQALITLAHAFTTAKAPVRAMSCLAAVLDANVSGLGTKLVLL